MNENPEPILDPVPVRAPRAHAQAPRVRARRCGHCRQEGHTRPNRCGNCHREGHTRRSCRVQVPQGAYFVRDNGIEFIGGITELNEMEFVMQQLIFYYIQERLDQQNRQNRQPITLPLQDYLRRYNIAVTTKTVDLDANPTECECDVCMESITPATLLKFGCGHGMCRDCTTRHLNVKNSCHMCRTPIKNIETYQPI